MNKPLAYEREPLRRKTLGLMLWLWRRQGRKTTNMAKLALMKMMKRPGRLVTFASVSLMVGRELLVKEAQVLNAAFAEWKTAAAEGGMKLEMNTDGLKEDDFLELFEKGRVEAKIWHSRTVYSRTVIIAPNVATARGWSGDVMIDEIGFIKDFKELWEAMEPIMSSDPDFSCVMATTPPNDDAHYSYELAVPPEGATFTPKAKGHWYVSQAGINVHRVDVYDAAAAGLKLYDLNTREEVTPEQHRSAALDRDAWDRNYALIFKTGGTAAVSLANLHAAMVLGRDRCVFAEDNFPPGWRELLGKGRIALGLDVATTEGGKSNPSSLSVLEEEGSRVYARLKIVFKTSDPNVTRAAVREALELGDGRRPIRLCIDATNERFFATDLKREFAARVVVELVISSESTTYMGESMSMKTYLGNLLINQLEDGLFGLPESRYVRDDYRLVVRDRGGFTASVDSQGRHGDTFDSDKLALHALKRRGGPARAEAVSVGGVGQRPASSEWTSPLARAADRMTGDKLYV